MRYKVYMFSPGAPVNGLDATIVGAHLASVPRPADVTWESPQVLRQPYSNGYQETVVIVPYSSRTKPARDAHSEVLHAVDDVLVRGFGVHPVRTVIAQVVDQAVAGLIAGSLTGGAGGASVANSGTAEDRFGVGILGAIVGGILGSYLGSLIQHELPLASGTKQPSNRWAVQWNDIIV